MEAYKIVQRLNNGSRVSLLMPKEAGLRKTYHANGKALLVDEGLVFEDMSWATDFIISLRLSYEKRQKIETWECEYSGKKSTVSSNFWIGHIVEFFDNTCFGGDAREDLKELFRTTHANQRAINHIEALGCIALFPTNALTLPAGPIIAENIRLTERVNENEHFN